MTARAAASPADVRTIKVPDVGEGIAEVELTEWHVAAGDLVQEDQVLADVMTDKASVEIPSPVAGRVLALGGKVGQMLAVGSELIRIGLDASAPLPAGEDLPAAETQQPDAEAAGPATAAPAPAPPSAPPAPNASASSPKTGDARPIAAPAVRRRAWELGIDLGTVPASGTAGRITQADLDAAAAAARTAGAAVPQSPPGPPAETRLAAAAMPAAGAIPVPAKAPSPVGAATSGPTQAAGDAYARRDDTQAVPVIGLRRRIALQMQESKRRIPHFSYVEELDVTELENLRATLNARWAAQRGKLTMLPLLMRAMVLALRDFPQVNARFDDEAGVITRHGAVHLGVATQTSNGLMVPVVRHAEARDVWGLAADVARLAEAARTGRATRDELSGSTITISSLGALGGIASTPVINRPEVAIVAVNRIVERLVLRAGSPVPRQTMNLSSSFDHRAVDGLDAAQFIQAVRALVEAPALLFVG